MDWISKDLPHGVRSYLLGVTFGLVASPCSTPVLASLLAWVASTGNIWLGAVLLLAYTAGYVAPLYWQVRLRLRLSVTRSSEMVWMDYSNEWSVIGWLWSIFRC